MPAITFERVEAGDGEGVRALSALASGIVREHFTPLLGEAQNEYMIRKFQSVEAISHQLAEGYRYYFVCAGPDGRVGFLGFYPIEGSMYLSKFYLEKNSRGRGYAHDMLDFVAGETRAAGLSRITLHVNRHNSAILAYERLGFRRTGAQCRPIGCGYVMDDYTYEYTL